MSNLRLRKTFIRSPGFFAVKSFQIYKRLERICVSNCFFVFVFFSCLASNDQDSMVARHKTITNSFFFLLSSFNLFLCFFFLIFFHSVLSYFISFSFFLLLFLSYCLFIIVFFLIFNYFSFFRSVRSQSFFFLLSCDFFCLYSSLFLIFYYFFLFFYSFLIFFFVFVYFFFSFILFFLKCFFLISYYFLIQRLYF